MTFKDTVTTTGGGTVTITNAGLLDINDRASMNLDGAFLQNGGGTVDIAADISTTADDITFNSNVTLTDDERVVFDSNGTIAVAGDIRFFGNITGTTAENLTLISGERTTTVDGAVSNIDNLRLQEDVASATGTVTFNGNVTATKLRTFARGYAVVLNEDGNFTDDTSFLNTSGVILGNETGDNFVFTGGLDVVAGTPGTSSSIAGSFTTSGEDINIADAVTINANTDLSTGAASGGDIVFGETLLSQANQNYTLDLTAGSGDVTFTGAVGGVATQELGAVAIASAGDVTAANTFTAASLLQSAGTGKTQFDNTVNLTAAGGMDITTDSVVLNGSVNAPLVDLTAVADINGNAAGTVTAGTINFNAGTGIGSSTALNLATNSLSAINTGAGDIDINNTATVATTVSNLTTGTGAITYDQTGNQSLALGTVTTANGNVSIDNAGGTAANITVGSITADTINDVIKLDAAGAIDDASPNNDTTTDITAAVIDLDAETGIGNSAHVDISGRTIDIDTTNGGIGIYNAATGATTINSITTNAGSITYGQTGGHSTTLTKIQTNAGNVAVQLDSGNISLVDVTSTGSVNLSTSGGDIDGGQFTGSSGNIVAGTIGLNSIVTANVGELFLNLTVEKGGRSGELDPGTNMIETPPDSNIVSVGTVQIGDIDFIATEVDISAILASLATLSSAQQQLESLLDATTASEFFMTPPLEIYIDMAEQSEFEEEVDDSLDDEF